MGNRKEWFLKVFRSGHTQAENLISIISDEKTKKHLYFITERGISSVVNYLNLKEVEKKSYRADKIARVLICVVIVVGVVQILATIF